MEIYVKVKLSGKSDTYIKKKEGSSLSPSNINNTHTHTHTHTRGRKE
jgi:hypothetical protein